MINDWFLARDVIYTSRAYAMMPVSDEVSVCPSICDGSTLAHYSYFRFQITIPLYRALLLAVLLAGGSSRAMLESGRLSCVLVLATN